VVGFQRVMRSRHVFNRLEASLLCQRAHLTYKPNMGPKRKPWVLSWLTSNQTLLRSTT